jgi:uncharacterized protein YegL
MTKIYKTAKEALAAGKANSSEKSTKHVFVLMDESGSMSGLEEAVTTGCNEFIHEFKDDADAKIWLSWFDETPGEPRTRFKVRGVQAGEVEKLTAADYNPRGATPLNDAIADAVDALDAEAGKDDIVFLAVITDGMENASEHSTESIKNVLEKREQAGWAVVFIGADHDVTAAASARGMHKAGRAFSFDKSGKGVESSIINVAAIAKIRLASEPGADGLADYDERVAAEHESRGGRIDDED